MRQAEIVDDDRQDPAGALAGREPAGAGERPGPRRCVGDGGDASGDWGPAHGRLEHRPAVGTDDLDVDHLPHGLRLAALDDLEVLGLQVGDVLALVVDDDRVDGGQARADAERRRVGRRLRLLAGEDRRDRRRHQQRHGRGDAERRVAVRMKEPASPVHHRTSNSTHCVA